MSGIKNLTRNPTLNFNIGCVSFSYGLKFRLLVLKHVRLIFPSFILESSFLNFKHHLYVFYYKQKKKKDVRNEHSSEALDEVRVVELGHVTLDS